MLSHTPTPRLLKMYFFYAHAQKEEIEVPQFQYTHFVVNLCNPLAFCFPNPEGSKSQARCFCLLVALTPALRHAGVRCCISWCCAAWTHRAVGWWYSAAKSSLPKKKALLLCKIFVISLVVQKMSVFSSDSCPEGWHK